MQTLSNGMNVWLSILIALAVGLAIGCVNGALVSFLGLQPFITTLIMMLAGRGMAKVITSGENTDASAVAGNEPLKWFANGFILGIPANFVIAVIIVILVGLLCRKTAMGMMIEAVGINQEASRMTGIKPKKILFLVYAISGFLAAIAGLFATASVMRVDVVKTGQDLEMYAILAVVIGGTSLLGGKFSLAGSAVGAVIIAMIRKTIITLGVNAEATPAFFAVVVIVICVMQAPKIHNLSANMKRKLRRWQHDNSYGKQSEGSQEGLQARSSDDPDPRGRGDLHPDDHHGSGVVRHLHSTGLHLLPVH